MKAIRNTISARNRRSGALVLGILLLTSGCSAKAADLLNPFASEPNIELGQRNNFLLQEESGESGMARRAREAVNQMGTYRAALPPQPQYPAMKPAVTRLMWIPDHKNKGGDLIPAYFYQLKIQESDFVESEVFELEEGVRPSGSQGGSSVPHIIKGSS